MKPSKKKKVTIAKRLPKDYGIGPRHKVRAQLAALCYKRRKSSVEILLITSRDTGRWILPKGWAIEGLGPAGSAAQEAWEEAGVRGWVHDRCIGAYIYDKVIETGTDQPITVAVYPIEVDRLEDKYPEKGQRKRRWFTPKKAAGRVAEPQLKRLLRKFEAPKARKKKSK